jgi:hypothetical protein
MIMLGSSPTLCPLSSAIGYHNAILPIGHLKTDAGLARRLALDYFRVADHPSVDLIGQHERDYPE